MMLAMEEWASVAATGSGVEVGPSSGPTILTRSSIDVIAKMIFGHAIGQLWAGTRSPLPRAARG